MWAKPLTTFRVGCPSVCVSTVLITFLALKLTALPFRVNRSSGARGALAPPGALSTLPGNQIPISAIVLST